MNSVTFPADTVARFRQLEGHQATAKTANELVDAVRGRIRNLQIVMRQDQLVLYGVCGSFRDVKVVLDTAMRMVGDEVRIVNMLEVV